ncbi:ribose/xylose/arabinose/galactoside ABC-type transport system permease subunit [Pararhizobium capsulatum DSM 1112]|uniref:Autoinducer 2 import system permease protein LsrC n=1 Tax=Pararhizobium capsulatum DSM 1112 TaxID=1121113 RepID=A0ABU0BY86_9HYPH|nr:ABC transporter permease [Pararhizobium capsulatum]MDQ0322611.1 ribose/xylose/arabinose/galactoside ABC-type transport system permease subunit [Pararhizobium capsulatum DSM 1112]
MTANFLRRNLRTLFPAAAFVLLFALYIGTHPRGLSTYVVTIWANQSALLVFAAFAQFFVVLVRGIDLSVGPMVALSNVVASYLLAGDGFSLWLGVIAVLATGVACGFVNGVVVAVGRIPPIIATLATGAIYSGIALFLRPTPGGDVNSDLSDAMTYAVGPIPTSLILIAILLIAIAILLKRTAFGLSLYGVGSSEHAAELTGISLTRTRIAAHSLGGLCAGIAGFYVAMVTLTGDAGIGPSYTLNSIAAIVLGGVSLAGGIGSPIGAVIGALLLKTVAALMFFSGLPPLAQPFFEGLILALAIMLGSLALLRVRNRLKLFAQ